MNTSSLDEDYHSPSKVRTEEVNSDVRNVMCSPLKSVSNHYKISYEKQKLRVKFWPLVLNIYSFSLKCITDDILLTPLPSNTDNCSQEASDIDTLAEAIRENLLMSTKSEKVKLLIISPSI